jgi:hypothetical protein
MNKLIRIILCHYCGTSFERDLDYRNCSNCFACTGCEQYICPGCRSEIVVIPKKETN